METININNILNREKYVKMLKDSLIDYDNNKYKINMVKAIYVYGDTGIGKTSFVNNILNELNYDIIRYDAADNRNSSIINNITEKIMCDSNVLSLFQKKKKKIIIVMDEIDGMNIGDKGGINSLIKLIRPKKTKKQKLEKTLNVPIICIGKISVDKKIKELMKVCTNIELNTPTYTEIKKLIQTLMSQLSTSNINKLSLFVNGDLRKLSNLSYLNTKNNNFFQNDTIENFLSYLSYDSHLDTKNTLNNLFETKYSFNEHNKILYETDRTCIGLLWHENIVDNIQKLDLKISIPFYINQLENMCYADYIDRVTFQHQIWLFNEMSSLLKTLYNNKLFHDFINQYNVKCKKLNIRFTKVLTKYSTEYNNSLFIQKMCQKLSLDKKDLLCFFLKLKHFVKEEETINMLDELEITKLDINRINKYIDKYLFNDAEGLKDSSYIDFDETNDDNKYDIDICDEY